MAMRHRHQSHDLSTQDEGLRNRADRCDWASIVWAAADSKRKSKGEIDSTGLPASLPPGMMMKVGDGDDSSKDEESEGGRVR